MPINQLTFDNGHLTSKDKKFSNLKSQMSNVLGFTLIELLVGIAIDSNEAICVDKLAEIQYYTDI